MKITCWQWLLSNDICLTVNLIYFELTRFSCGSWHYKMKWYHKHSNFPWLFSIIQIVNCSVSFRYNDSFQMRKDLMYIPTFVIFDLMKPFFFEFFGFKSSQFFRVSSLFLQSIEFIILKHHISRPNIVVVMN